jgi:putative sigma-54 modulation protein
MNVNYTGIKKELPSKLQEKLNARLTKLSKLVERNGPKEAHVVVTQQRHLLKAEVTMYFYGHPLVGVASDGDLFAALCGALDKLEKQATKQTAKWRDTHYRAGAVNEVAVEEKPQRGSVRQPSRRTSAPEEETELAGVVANSDGQGPGAQRIFRVNHHQARKPMTLDEALLEMDRDQDYLVFLDAERERVSMLVRRRDGHFDLIES